MLFHKCWQFIMKVMSPQGVGLILLTLIGGLSATFYSVRIPTLQNSSSEIFELHRRPFYRYNGTIIRRKEITVARPAQIYYLKKHPVAHKVYKKIIPEPSIFPKINFKPNSQEYTPQTNASIERINSKIPMVIAEVSEGRYAKDENVSRKKIERKRVRSRERNPNQRTNGRNRSNTTLRYKNQRDSLHETETINLSTSAERYNRPKNTKKKNRDKVTIIRSPFELKSANNSLNVKRFNNTQGFNFTIKIRPPDLSDRTSGLIDAFQSIRRKGKSFIIGQINSREDTDIVDSSSKLLEKPSSNETIKNSSVVTAENLFNYTYQISAIKRDALYPHDPFNNTETFDVRTTIGDSYISLLREKYESGTRPKNVTIYELLKPRLRTTQQSRNLWKVALNRGDNRFRIPINSNVNMTEGRKSESSLDVLLTTLNNATLIDTFVKPRNNTMEIIGDRLKKSNSRNVYNVTQFPLKNNRNPQLPNLLSRKNPNSPTNGSDLNEELGRSEENNLHTSILTATNLENIIKKVPTLRERIELNRQSADHSFTVTNTDKSVSDSQTHKSTAINAVTNPSQVVTDDLESVTDLQDADSIREAKMAEESNTAFNNPKLDPKTFYDYLMKTYSNKNGSNDSFIPEYKPGSFFRYSDIYKREPVLGIGNTRSPHIFAIRGRSSTPTTTEPYTTPTTFESKRTTTVRFISTFYPNRMRDVTMRFENVPDPPTTFPTLFRDLDSEEDADDAEFRDALDPGFTMEKLAFLLIGTCCGLSILCLCVVVIAIKCRRVLLEKKLKEHFRRRMYQHETIKSPNNPWRQQLFDHFLYMNRLPESSRSSANSCNCRCVTWTLGPRNLEASRPFCGPNRSSSFLSGQKKLPFGAASSLRYESMMGRKRAATGMTHAARNDPPLSDSTPEDDSLEHQDTDSRDTDSPRRCTCIDYTMWPVSTDVLRGRNHLCSIGGRYVAGDCNHHHGAMDERPLPKDCPPPVTGSNYLGRSEGVVYWSSNNERLI